MKFVSAAILGALVCAMIAPSTQTPMLLELPTSAALTNVYEKFMVYHENSKCILNVLDENFGKTDMVGVWNTFVIKMNQMLVEWNKVQTIEDGSHKIKQTSTLLAHALGVMHLEVPFFIRDLKMADLLKVVRSEVSTKCLGKADTFELLEDADYLALWKSLADLSAHVYDVVADLAEYEALWSWQDFRLLFKQQQGFVMDCVNGCNIDVDICTIKDGLEFFKMAAEFTRVAIDGLYVSNLLNESEA